jgi:branched-chain amino acid transport system ATP-binding protein
MSDSPPAQPVTPDLAKPPGIAVTDLVVMYGCVVALHGLSFTVPAGSISTIIGANGAGKSTTLRAISGLVRPKSGTICYGDTEITRMPPHEIVGRGLCHVPEGRMVFANLTVRENLALGAYLRRDKVAIAHDLDFVCTLFPRLRERFKQQAGTLSGGEQQMLAIGRALMGSPRALLLDEPSLGIAPLLTRTIFEKIVEINRTLGLTILLVEQNANLALEISQHAFVIETGTVAVTGPASELKRDPRVKEAYLGG